MAWVLIAAGSIALIYGINRLYLLGCQGKSKQDINKQNKSKQLNKDKDQRYQVAQQYQQTTQQLGKTEMQKLKKDFNNNYKVLKKLNKNMTDIINELSWKEKSIKRAVDNIKHDISSAAESSNAKSTDVNNNQKNKENFKEMLNENIKQDKQSEVPEQYNIIFELYREGNSIDEIAEKLDIGVRETRLIFKLYGKEADNLAR